jgi:CHAD domain-containing protein
MTTIGETRKKNLRRLIDEKYEGILNRLAKAANIQHSQLWRVLKDDPVKGQPRYLGETLARRLEEVSGVHRGWLDQDEISQAYAQADALAARIRRLPSADQQTILRMIDVLGESDEAETGGGAA